MYAHRKLVEATLDKFEREGLNGPIMSAIRVLACEFLDMMESRTLTVYTEHREAYVQHLSKRLRYVADLLDASVNGGDKVGLKTGEQSDKRIVETIERTLQWLSKEHPIAWKTLTIACQNGSSVEIVGYHRVLLMNQGLLDNDGKVPEFIKPLVLSAASKSPNIGDPITTPLMKGEANVPV